MPSVCLLRKCVSVVLSGIVFEWGKVIIAYLGHWWHPKDLKPRAFLHLFCSRLKWFKMDILYFSTGCRLLMCFCRRVHRFKSHHDGSLGQLCGWKRGTVIKSSLLGRSSWLYSCLRHIISLVNYMFALSKHCPLFLCI